MKKTIAIVLALLVLAMGLAGCGNSQAAVVGKWEGMTAGTPFIMEFKSDNKVVMTADNEEYMSGTYTFDGKTKIDMDFGSGNTAKGELNDKKDSIIMTDSDGNAVKLSKIK